MQYKLPQTTSIGRSSSCDIQVSPQQTKVSRQHAQIRQHSNGMYVLYDQSSAGTYVNDKREKQIVLRDGDRIRLAKGVDFRFSNGFLSFSMSDIKVKHPPYAKTRSYSHQPPPQEKQQNWQSQSQQNSHGQRMSSVLIEEHDVKDMGNLKDFVIKGFGAEVFNFQKVIPFAGANAVSLNADFTQLFQQRGLVPSAVFTHNEKKYLLFKKVLAKFPHPAKVIRTAVSIDTHGNDLFIAIRHFEIDGSRTLQAGNKSKSEGWMYIVLGLFLFIGIVGIYFFFKGLAIVANPNPEKMPFEEGSTGRSESILLLETILQSLEQALAAKGINISSQVSTPL